MTQLTKLLSERANVIKAMDELDKSETSAGRNYLEHEDYRSLSDKLDALGGQIEMAEAIEADRAKREQLKAEGRESADPGDGLEGREAPKQKPEKRNGPFESFGEQLQAIVASEREKRVDSRLLEVRAPSGLSTVVGEDGGFLVQSDFSATISQRVFDDGELLRRCRMIPISSNANSVVLPRVKESSRADGSRWGGLRAYWTAEAGEITASKPAIDKRRIELEKLAVLVYLTEETIEDAAAMEALVMSLAPQELRFAAEDAIVNGSGVGKPLGILNAPALVSVAKENGQAAATIVPENIVKMWSRIYPANRRNTIWIHNCDVEPQLPLMTKTDGTAYGYPVFLPAGGLSGSQYSTVYGRPMIPSEHAATLGTVGDIILADLSEYAIIQKGGIKAASSMHVRFIYDEMALRFTWRLNGQPLPESALTPKKGTSTLSEFVALATRSS